VVDKPAGMVVHPGAGKEQGTLVHALLDRRIAGGDPERPGIVHRLDRDTSGLLVVARSDEAWERLSRFVRDRRLERRYVALVRGRPRSRSGRIEAPIGRDRRDPTRRSLDTNEPREAITHFEVARLLDGEALLDVRLETGRTHQIRVHLAAIGLPIVGDPLYGVPDDRLDRQFLHAARLAFPHPLTGERVEAESPLPPDLAARLDPS
jgi:23S rRNA pseudouridine1911/1915/1917 synthase